MIKKFYLKLLMSLMLVALTVPQAWAETADVGGSSPTNTVPLNGMYGDYGYHSQMVYSQAMLEDAGLPAGAKITAITFYAQGNISATSGSENNPLTIKMGQPDGTSLSSFITDGLTTVSTTGDIWSGNTSVTLQFDSEYSYDGGNLLIDVSWSRNASGKYGTIYWLASSATGASRYANNNSSGVEQSSTSGNYLPKITFTYEAGSVEPITSGEVLTTSLEFNTYAGVAKTDVVSIKNTGNQPFTPTFSTLNAPFSIEAPAEIPARQTKDFIVTYNRATVGSDNATLVVTINGETTNVTLTGNATEAPKELTVAENGTDESSKLPVNGNYFDTQNSYGQTIYNKSGLGLVAGKNITKVKYYSNTVFNASKIAGTVLEIYMMETDQNNTIPEGGYSSQPLDFSGATALGEYTVQGDETTGIEFILSTPFAYSGNKNLAIQVKVKTKSPQSGLCYQDITWIGEDQSDNNGYSYGSTSGSGVAFLPKTTFSYSDDETPATPVITVNPATVDAFNTEVGTPVTATVNVSGENLTGDITAAITGDNADCFTAVLENGVLTITYDPTAAGNHTATLTLSSTGAQDVTIALTGNATAAVVPTLVVNPATLTINTEPNTTGTATFTVTGTNLTNDITLTASNGFTVTPTTIAAADAANGVTVTVAYPASNVGTFNGTITLNSNGATEKTVSVTANVQEIVAEGTVTPTSLNFGEVLVGQTSAAQLVKVSNTGSDAFTPSFSIDNPAFSIDEPTTIAGGTSISYNVTYTPTAAGVQNGVLTVSFGGLNHTVALTGIGKELAAYDITSSAASGVHNFGDVFEDGFATWDVTLTNNGASDVTPVIEGLAAPFSAENVPATLAAGQSAIITFKFAPTAIQAYGPTSIVVKFAETTAFQFDYTFRGNGIEDTGTLPPSTFDNETYTWTDDNGDDHTSPYSEIATDPNQMIALLKAVYTNKNLPGNYYRGYDANGNPEKTVGYPAIGQVTVDKNYNVEFVDAYGWGMTHDETAYPTIQTVNTSSSNERIFYTMNPNEYKPNQEGVTLLLVEMKDGVGASTITTPPTNYASLKNIYSKMFKSVRVIPNSKKVTKTIDVNGTATNVPGTLFKIDCDKMNRFFFLAKGRLRLYDNHEYLTNGLNASSYALANKKIVGGSVSVSSSDKENTVATVNPFNAMYEQFSPVDLNNAQESSDVYQLLINMESYNVEHDCEAIPWASTTGASGTVTGHEFNMYGKASISDDCQDVRDLMFFVPDYRMMYWSGRDKAHNTDLTDEYTNYYEQYAPNMAMYVIRQNEITGERNGEAEEYTLHLSWESNLTDFVPGENGEYTIYLVNADGTYAVVAQHIPSNQTTYDLTVAMQEHGQQVTYVIQGQDNTRFLSLQYSNEESFIIPGTNAFAKFQLDPKADFYSRFNPEDEFNYYANGMKLSGYVDATSDMYVGKTVYFYRKPVTITTEGTTTEGEWTKFAEVTPSSATSAGLATFDQRTLDQYQYGYKANGSTLTIASNVFTEFYDNFRADVSSNEHADFYKYIMVVDGTPAEIANKYHSNEITVKVFKTKMSNIQGSFDWAYVEGDDVRQDADKTTQFDIDVEHSSKTEVLRYGAYRWDSDDTKAILASEDEDISPNGQASNQGEYYSVYMNGNSYIGDDVYVAQGETAQATFVDEVPIQNPDEYTYAPVVETFTGRADYNTYGAPMQTTATGLLGIAVGDKVQSEDVTWTAKGKTYTYYNVFLDITHLEIPEGYKVAMLRAWRHIDPSFLGEQEGKGYEERADLDANGDYLFLKDGDNQYAVGENVIGSQELVAENAQYGKICAGTFGAVKLEDGETMPMKFNVRIYFTKEATANPAPALKSVQSADGKYYITEFEINDELNNQIPTSIFGVVTVKEVAGVKYYNLAGIESDVPFQGVNIEVTTYKDGSRTSRKIMK